MGFLDIPTNSRVWYAHEHMASNLAYDAIAQKTRFLQVRGEIIGCVREWGGNPMGGLWTEA